MEGLHECKKNKTCKKLTIQDICLIGIMVAVIEVCKVTFSFLPNIELTSFWLIMFTLFFGWKVVFVVPVFILLEGFMYGVHIWWFMYLYVWPLLVILTWMFRKQESVWFWTFFSAIFGLLFGFLCSFVYFVIGFADGGITAGLHGAFAWWIAGIPWDFVHGAGNFVFMLVLYHPVKNIMQKVKKDIN